MNFVSKLFTLFVIANIFSANISSGVVFAVEPSMDEKSGENVDKNSESELKSAGVVSIHREDCAFSYELDGDGNIKNVKDLLADNVENTNSGNNDNQDADTVCIYSSCSRFEVFSGNGTVKVRESDQNQGLSKEDSSGVESENGKEELEGENEAEKKSESAYEVQDSSEQDEEIEEYDEKE